MPRIEDGAAQVRALGGMNDSSSTTVRVDVGESLGSSVVLLQRPDSLNHGFAVWDSSVGFARFLAQSPKVAGDVAGKAVLEFGCGCGLLGVVFHRLKASAIMLTDLPDVVDNAAACMAANGVSAWQFPTTAPTAASADGPGRGRSAEASPPTGASASFSSFDGVCLMGHSWGDDVAPLFGASLGDAGSARGLDLSAIEGGAGARAVPASAGIHRPSLCRPYDILIGASHCCCYRIRRCARRHH